MNQESVVYGIIKDSISFEEALERRRANRRAMMALPPSDNWSLLSREMFTAPSLRDKQINYQTEVMHFGASYQAVEHEWEQWIQDFESLLQNMYWTSATVHLETELNGIHTFTWETSTDCHLPGSQDMKVHCEWSHEAAVGF